MKRHQGLERLLKDSRLLGAAGGRSAAHRPLAYDGAGRLYAYGHDGALRSVSVREQLLEDAAEGGGDAAAGLETGEGRRLREARPEPTLPCAPQRLHVNRAGTYALVYGHEEGEDGVPALHVISLTQREEGAQAAPLADSLLVDRPGLQVLQVAWHPGSSVHFAVLASDNVFRLYHVDDLTAPEQQVELQLRERQPLGLTDMEGSHAVAFTFGSLHLWERFAVFFACSDGKVFVLTPLAPFGCMVPASALQRLHAQTEAAADANDRACTRAWLQQTFPDLWTRGGNGNGSSAAAALDTIPAVPAALDEHTPALAGPLPLAAPGGAARTSLLDFFEPEDGDITACAALGASSVSCLALGASGGAIGLAVLADAVEPRWAPQPPRAALHAAGRISRTRAQAARVADGAPQLLLLDIVHLVDAQAAAPRTGGPGLQLLPSPADADCLYAAHSHGVLAVKLPWLPRIAALCGGGEVDDGGAALPPTVLMALTSTSAQVAGITVIGDALLGVAVAVADAGGAVRCFTPARGGGSSAAEVLWTPASPAAAAAASPAVDPQTEAAVAQRFGQLLQGPPAGDTATETGPRYAATPEGQRALTDAVASLRERHVEFAHAAHHDLLQHAKRLRGVADEQARQLEGLKRQAAVLQEAAATRHKALTRFPEAACLAMDLASADKGVQAGHLLHEVTEFNANLASRFKLLAALHWSLPQPLSAAEAGFASRELPALERIASDLQRKTQDAGMRWDATAALPAASGQEGSRQTTLALPAAQVRKVRQALSEQAAVLVASRRKAQAVEEALAEQFEEWQAGRKA